MSIKLGYYPADPEKAFESDSALDAVNDVVNGLVKIVWEKEPAVKGELAKAFFTGPYPLFLKAMSNRITSNGSKFLTGDTLCTADFHFGSLIWSVINNELREKVGDVDYLKVMFDSHEPLVKYAENIRQEFSSYLETRPKCPR